MDRRFIRNIRWRVVLMSKAQFGPLPDQRLRAVRKMRMDAADPRFHI